MKIKMKIYISLKVDKGTFLKGFVICFIRTIFPRKEKKEMSAQIFYFGFYGSQAFHMRKFEQNIRTSYLWIRK